MRCGAFIFILKSRIRYSFQTSKACPDDPFGKLFRAFVETSFHPCPSVSIRSLIAGSKSSSPGLFVAAGTMVLSVVGICRHIMASGAAEKILFALRWYGGMISTNLEVIWEMSD